MRNKFGATCFRCGIWVKPGEGHFEKVTQVQRKKYGPLVAGKKWITQHASCAIEHRGTTFSVNKSRVE